jgi:branched-chain amino acid transport system permease protein
MATPHPPFAAAALPPDDRAPDAGTPSGRLAARRLAGIGAAAAVLVALGPWLLDAYLINVLIKAFLFAVVAITVDLLWGHTGHLTFGQSAFFGLGAYAAGLSFTHLGFSGGTALLAMAGAVVGAMALAAAVGWLSFYRGASPFFATVISLVLPIVMTQLLLSGGEWTGSSSGLTGYASFDLSMDAWFRITGFGLVAVAVLAWLFVRSDAGRILGAIRDNEVRCAFLGLRVSRIKILLLVVTAGIAGLAGFAFGAYGGVVAPELSGFVLGTEMIIWVALGGRGTLWGPLLGAILINVATAYLSASIPFAWQLVLGAAFVLVIVCLPQGLVPLMCSPWIRRSPPSSTPRLVSRPIVPTHFPELDTQSDDDLDSVSAQGWPALDLQEVTRSFGSLKVLDGVTLTAYPGELIGLIGPNGAGKTTLMRCISDGAERSGGQVRLNGRDLERRPPEDGVRFGLGRKFQNANIFESLTVADCLRLATTRHERPSLWRRRPVLTLPLYALAVLQATQLDQQLGAVARDLSHGQQQALELAMVLALAPKVVLLDEPTAGLTTTERTQIGQVLADLAHRYDLCCLLVEHDLDFVRDIATRIVVMHQGRMAKDGSFEEVTESLLVKTIYAGTAMPAEERA